VNVIGLVAVTQALLPLLRRAQGRIAIVGSIAGRSALPGSGAYDSSKYAIEAIADALRMELQGSGISVSLIEPGAVATPLWEKSLGDIARLRESAAPEVRTRYAALLATLAREAERSARKAISPEKVARRARDDRAPTQDPLCHRCRRVALAAVESVAGPLARPGHSEPDP
jgi:NAD(P)-dependent dehydrogenase (short-subunit alcohol dehydrogenase family)